MAHHRSTPSWKPLVAAVAALAIGPLVPDAFAAPLPGGSLNPLIIPKYVQPLVVPPAMPAVGENTYDIAVREFQQQVLPPGFGMTRVWGYGSTSHPGTVAEGGSFHYPAFTIMARQGEPTTVRWRNELVKDPVACRASSTPSTDPSCEFVPYFLPVDQTLHWANPPKDCRPEMPGMDPPPGPDCTGQSPLPYTGPAPIVTHLHGGHIDPDVDGYPEAWYLPAARNIPEGYATVGSNFPASWTWDGTATYTYRNDQRGTTLWYHDHSLGMTRTNVYTGMAGFYFLRDAYEEDLIAGTNSSGFNTSLTRIPGAPYEIPLAIQDRSFNADGSLFYATTRRFFDGFAGPYYPLSDVAPTWNPEFFGNTMVVNGRTWPFHVTEARRYRVRFLNGSDSRFLILRFADAAGRPNGLRISIIGNDGGFLPGKVATVTQLVIGPGERYDTIVDFGPYAGQRLILQNVGPDMPWGGGPVPVGAQADPATTGQVMRFDVALKSANFVDPVPPAGKLVLNQPPDPFGGPAANGTARTLTLNEIVSGVPRFGGPIAAQLGDAMGPLPWMAPVTEAPPVGSTEVWQIVNRTVDSHPIHLHQVQFVVMDRTPIDLAAWDAAVAACNAGTPGAICPPDPFAFVPKNAVPVPANPWEAGGKDTAIMNPGQITRVRAFFDIPGLYVWHCHILSHEDNEMMRPYCVTDPTDPAFSCAP
ncbi:multicopper oxidase family protein [Anaeromyxobacter sp. Fw109-5]|uniref:multicopper oxidase family protein n=1 Tax=Anaeromyxobacter sp. (strain Fw109-5) TaxID=404589 RepID=UPI0000ED6C3D|nr:multicopper oxidase [Anaeromyxobacter sp. Fw109-5]ABS28070.1 Bilirubin oxidase [Anaeromyxobacter sp. Fw109-5]